MEHARRQGLTSKAWVALFPQGATIDLSQEAGPKPQEDTGCRPLIWKALRGLFIKPAPAGVN